MVFLRFVGKSASVQGRRERTTAMTIPVYETYSAHAGLIFAPCSHRSQTGCSAIPNESITLIATDFAALLVVLSTFAHYEVFRFLSTCVPRIRIRPRARLVGIIHLPCHAEVLEHQRAGSGRRVIKAGKTNRAE